MRLRPPSAAVGGAALVGGSHLALVVALDSVLAYPIRTLGTTPFDRLVAAVGVFLLGAVPALLAFRYRLVAPLGCASLWLVRAVTDEFSTPTPSFSTLGGYTIVDGHLFLLAYVDTWYVWLFGWLCAGLAEYVARTHLDRLPAPSSSLPRLPVPADERSAAAVSLAVGVAHAAVMHAFAWPRGLADDLVALPWTLGGMVLLGVVPTWLALRRRLVAPLVAFVVLAVTAVDAQTRPLADDPHALYLVGWVLPLALVLLAGVGEYGVRWVRRRVAAAGGEAGG